MKKTSNFEDFLRIKHAETYIGTDDDMSDAFEHWVSNLDAQDFIDMADEAINTLRVD